MKFLPFLPSFFFACLLCQAGPHCSVSIKSSEIERDKAYARIPYSRDSVLFGVEITGEPTTRVECRLGEPKIEWFISPSTTMGHTDTDASTFIVYFNYPADFGKSYKISAKVTWPEIEIDSNNTINEIILGASYTVDAIQYSFEVSCSDGTQCLNNISALVDNHPATAVVNPLGCTRQDLLRMTISSRPEQPNPLNKSGTGMVFMPTSDPCTFTTPKTFWYGLAGEEDCYMKQFYYLIKLKSDGEVVAQNRKTVGWPDEHPEMTLTPMLIATKPCIEVMPNGLFKMLLQKWRFELHTSTSAATDQYAEETALEEDYHRLQALGRVGLDCGGEPDLFDMNRVFAGETYYSDVYEFHSFIGESRDDFKFRVLYEFHRRANAESEASYDIWQRDTGYREKVAKRHAGYNAAWKYHCTYGNIESRFYYGPEEEQQPRAPRE